MASKLTARQKLEKLLNESVAELSDEYKRKAQEAWDRRRQLDEEYAKKEQTLRASHREALEAAAQTHNQALAKIVETGLMALKLAAPIERSITALVEIAHGLIPRHQRADLGIPLTLPDGPTADADAHPVAATHTKPKLSLDFDALEPAAPGTLLTVPTAPVEAC